MPLPIVHPKKYRFGREFKRKDVSEYIKLFKFRFNKFPEFDEYFVEDWAEELKEVVDVLTVKANNKLNELIIERAYAENASGVYYERTEMFPDAFEVDIYVDDKSGNLHADIIFYYDYLDDREYGYVSGKTDTESAYLINGARKGLPSYKSVVDGRDMRKKMPDILNTPVTYDYYLWYKSGGKKRSKHYMAIRKGRWYEEFDKWFRTEGEAEFLDLCKKHGII